jgi:hypothetical protein
MRPVPPEAHRIEIDTVCDDGYWHVAACDNEGVFLDLIESFDNSEEAWVFAENLAKSKSLPLFHRDDPSGPSRYVDQDFEDIIRQLINRANELPEGSTEHAFVVHQLRGLLNTREQAARIIELDPFGRYRYLPRS